MDKHPNCPFCGETPEHIHVFAGEEIIKCPNWPVNCSMRPVWGGTQTWAWAQWDMWAANLKPIR